MKQSKLRRRRVIRFAIMYYVMFVVFIALIVGPAVAGKMFKKSGNPLESSLSSLDFRLIQPNYQDNKNTNGTSQTGTGNPDYTGVYKASTSGGSGSTGKVRLF